MDPQNIHANKSSINLNIAANNSLKSSDLKFGAVIFNEKYITNVEKFTTGGLSSNIMWPIFKYHLWWCDIQESAKFIGSIQVDIT
jgi:hypothetical protein